jgi:hypothetical protein
MIFLYQVQVIATEKTKKPISNSCPAKTVLVFRMLSEKNRNASNKKDKDKKNQ